MDAAQWNEPLNGKGGFIMSRPIKATKSNINVFQSYVLTTARYNFSSDEKRILYRLVEFAQSTIKKATNGEPIKNHLCPLYYQELINGDVAFGIYIKDILNVSRDEFNNSPKHYDRIKNAFKALAKKTIEWEDTEQQIWRCTPLVHNVVLQKKTGFVNFSITDWFWDAILDFTKGYRKYELLTAMKLKSPYSMRFYELMSGQKKPIDYTVEQIRNLFSLEEKYARPSSIRKRIIIPAKKELDENAPYSFDFKALQLNEGKKTSPIIGFRFYPIFNESKQDKDLQKQERQSKLTSRNVFKDSLTYQVLKYDYLFDAKEISRNKATIANGESVIPDWIDFLKSIRDTKGYKNSDNKKGYLIGAIKNKIKEQKNELIKTT